MMTQTNLARLEEQCVAAAPGLFAANKSPEEKRAGIALLHQLAKGEPVTCAQLALALDVSAQKAEAFLKESRLAPAVHTDEEGRVIGFWGLSTVPTQHRLRLGDRTLWAWCAQDSLFLPELVGETTQIESTDPESGVPVSLTVSPDRIEAVEPEGVVVSMVRPETTDLTSFARIIATACHFVYFFASRASGERWVAKHPETMLLSLEEAFALGKRQNVRVFGPDAHGDVR
jgi:alkylmercury lyase